MTPRTRPLTRADWDVRMGPSRVHGESGFEEGFVLEGSRKMLGVCTYRHVAWPVTRGRDGWAAHSLEMCADDPLGHVIRIQNLHISRGQTVQEVLPLVRAVQRHAREQGAEWVAAVWNPSDSGVFRKIQEVQMDLQQGIRSAPVCWLFWELGFVDVILEDMFLVFLWRNPAC